MALPLRPPVPPQLARSRGALPEGEGWAYEPKWDGFRAIAFVDGGEVHLQSRNGKPLHRYFPELRFPPGRYVVDGEIVILDERAARSSTCSASASTRPRRACEAGRGDARRFVAFDVLSRDDDVLRAAVPRAPHRPRGPRRRRRSSSRRWCSPPRRPSPGCRTPRA